MKGPFSSIRAFNDWLLVAAARQNPGSAEIINRNEPYRQFLPDDGKVGDIIISETPGPRKVLGIIDWEQAGWYPEY